MNTDTNHQSLDISHDEKALQAHVTEGEQTWAGGWLLPPPSMALNYSVCGIEAYRAPGQECP